MNLVLNIAFLPGDVSDERVVKELTKTAWEKFGGIDVLINNAGITRDRLLIGMRRQILMKFCRST